MISTFQRKRILVVTYPAYGHIIPVLELARKLTAFHDVSFAVSASAITGMEARGIVPERHSIKTHPIDDGFAGALDPTDFPSFVLGMDVIFSGIEKMVESLPVRGLQAANCEDAYDIIIAEVFVASRVVKCREKGIALYHFSADSLGAQLIYFNIPEVPIGNDVQIEEGTSNEKLARLLQAAKNWSHEINSSYASGRGLIIDSFKELEKDAYHALSAHSLMNHAKVFAVGPLIPKEPGTSTVFNNQREKLVIDWLDQKPLGSVITVSFGTIVRPTEEQLHEIAKALRSINRPFLWSLQREHYVLLPEWFRPESGEIEGASQQANSLIVPWVPQKLVLGHKCIGLFLSHCGWNSSLESLANGVPVLCWPIMGDQAVNARLLADLGCGLVVDGTEKNETQLPRLVTAEDIEELIRKVGGFTEQCIQSTYHKQAGRWKERIKQAHAPGGCSFQSLSELLKDIESA